MENDKLKTDGMSFGDPGKKLDNFCNINKCKINI